MTSTPRQDVPGVDELSSRFDTAVPSLVARQDAQRQASGARQRARARFLRALDERSPRRGVRLAAWLLSPALAAAALSLWLLRTPSPIRFTAGDTAGRPGTEIVAGDSALPLRFGDGSEVELQALGRARGALSVDELWRDGARVALRSGRARVHVVHRDGARWLFTAGPYRVRVIGTRFELSWTPESAHFSLALSEGRVEVVGGALTSPTIVEAGRSLEIDPGKAAREAAAAARTPAEASGAAEDAVAPGAPGDEENGSGAAPPRRERTRMPHRPTTEAPAAWLALADAGRYADALTAAESEGFASICSNASLPDLMTLAEAARFARNPARSREALMAVRSRFGGEVRSRTAVFMLGRLALEGRDYREAERRFREYLAASPGGPLAPEVHGRLLEALENGGHHEGARAEAALYLEHFPDGSYATLAREILAR